MAVADAGTPGSDPDRAAPRLVGERTTDDQAHPTAGSGPVEGLFGPVPELGQQVAVGRLDAAVVGPEHDVVAGGEAVDVAFDREGAGVFEGVGEDRRDLRPITTPPWRLLGTKGMSWPICHSSEFTELFRDDPVPTMSPTKATGRPASFRRAIRPIGSSTSARLASNERAWSGMSARDHASVAGERSSVLISPSTLNTVRCTASGTAGRAVNQSASAQDRRTERALGLPFSAIPTTSWKASKTSRVCPSARLPVRRAVGCRAVRRGPARCIRPAWCRGARRPEPG